MPALTAKTIAQQLASAHQITITQGGSPRGGLGAWGTLLRLAEAAPATQRTALVPLIEQAGTSNGQLEIGCLAGLCRWLPESEARDRIRARLTEISLSEWDTLGTLLSALPQSERAQALHGHLERALSLPEDRERWDACDALTSSLNSEESRQWERWFGEESRRRFGRISDDPYRWLDDGPTPEQTAQRIKDERARWGATFEAWRLGDEATTLPESEQGPAFDRAIDAFEELIETPIDPGNDEGPFWAVARYLSLAQVRRALSILARMKADDWCYELAGSKAALLTRLAWLGQRDEALGVLRTIGTKGDFDAHWRATAWGGLISGRLANENELTLAEALRDAGAEDAQTLLNPQGRFRVLSELHYRADTHRLPAHAAPIAEECIEEAQRLLSHDAKLGRISLEECVGTWAPALPTERWLQLIEKETDGATRIELYEALLDAEESCGRSVDLTLRRLLDELKNTQPPYPANMLRLLFERRSSLSPTDLLPAWESWLEMATKGGFLAALRDVDEILGELVAFLGGPDAPAAVCRVLADIKPG